MFQKCGPFAIELVFPKCAEVRVSDDEAERNKKVVSQVMSGEASQCQTGIKMLSGSRVEGLAMEPGWGFEAPDIDMMTLYGGTHTVCTKGTQTNENPFGLTLSTANCYPAYYRIKVKGLLEGIPKSPAGWMLRLTTLTESELAYMLTLPELFSLFLDGFINSYYWHFAVTPFITCLLDKLVYISWYPSLIVSSYLLLMLMLTYLYGHVVCSFIYVLSIAYILKPRIIYTVAFLNSSYVLWVNLEIFYQHFYQGQSSILQSNTSLDRLIHNTFSGTCAKWLGFPRPKFFVIERLTCLLLSIVLIFTALDRYESYVLFQHFRIMTINTSWFPGVLNEWLVYITRGKIRWLSSANSIQKRREFNPIDSPFGGPSQNICKLLDSVPALVCTTPFPTRRMTNDMQHNLTWPVKELQKFINKIPGVLVAVGHFHSRNNDIEWRASWSVHEILLAETIPAWAKQGYRAFKYTLKVNLTRQRAHHDNAGGRGLVGSYHMKTLFYEYLQNPKAWISACPYRLFLSLLCKLKKHLRTRNLPHFFVPQCNLLQTTPPSELRLALRCVKRILSDPITAILQSPSHIHSVYGGWPWSGKAKQSQQLLIRLIHKMQIGKLSNNDQSLLKSHIQAIDTYRQQKWRINFCDDAEVDPSTRHPLISLESMLFAEPSFSIESGKTTSMVMRVLEYFATLRSHIVTLK